MKVSGIDLIRKTIWLILMLMALFLLFACDGGVSERAANITGPGPDLNIDPGGSGGSGGGGGINILCSNPGTYSSNFSQGSTHSDVSVKIADLGKPSAHTLESVRILPNGVLKVHDTDNTEGKSCWEVAVEKVEAGPDKQGRDQLRDRDGETVRMDFWVSGRDSGDSIVYVTMTALIEP